jgi:hypothetical protein
MVADVQAAAPDEPGEQGQRHVGIDASSDDAVDAEALLLATGQLKDQERAGKSNAKLNSAEAR